MEEPFQNQNPAYYQPARDESVMSVGKWLVTMLLMIIPIANIILLIVWAVSDTENRNRSNWAKAQLIMMGIVIGLYILIFVLAMAAFGLGDLY